MSRGVSSAADLTAAEATHATGQSGRGPGRVATLAGGARTHARLGNAQARECVRNADLHFIGPQGPGECVHRTAKEILAIQ